MKKRIALLLALVLALAGFTVYAEGPQAYTSSPVSDTITGTRLEDQKDDFTVIFSRATAVQQISGDVYLYDLPVDSYVAAAPAEGNDTLFATLSYYDSADNLLRMGSLGRSSGTARYHVISETDRSAAYIDLAVTSKGQTYHYYFHAVEGSFAVEPGTDAYAQVSTTAVIVNGQKVDFQVFAVAGNNYFKLRDLAAVLNGTHSQFEVEWNADTNAIQLTSHLPYTEVGGELTVLPVEGDVQFCYATESALYLDGRLWYPTAYKIGNNNYFKLRDLAAVMDFGVSWSQEEWTITIDTSLPYEEDLQLSAE